MKNNYLKSSDPKNQNLIEKIADVFCSTRYNGNFQYYPNDSYNGEFHVNVFFEHEQFWMKVWCDKFEEIFSVVDSECAMCNGEVDYCKHCGSYEGIGFEFVDGQIF